jgi:hypothetical protein
LDRSPIVWQETISRGAAIALMHNFSSVAEALKELVDNPIDYRQGQELSITITEDKRSDVVVVESDGGRGMGSEEIQIWLNWGDGEHHNERHIGRWHQGGKAACGFLGAHVRLWAKRAASNDVWFLEDEDWATRRKAKSFGPAVPAAPEQLPDFLRHLSFDRGHVRIEISKLNRDRRWNLHDLKRELSNTYRSLLRNGALRIEINGDQVAPLDIPLSSSTPEIELRIDGLLGGRKALGWAGRMQRDQVAGPLKSGLRLIYNGRLVKEGEWFGYNHEGKGALYSLIGELNLNRFTANPNKTDFVERGDLVWQDLEREVLRQLQPLISALRASGAEERVNKAEKQRATEVADELERVYTLLQEGEDRGDADERNGSSTEIGPKGRKRSSGPENRPPALDPRGPNRNPPRPRTAPPEDPVGSLVRLLDKITGGSARPPLRIRSWDASERSAWTTEGAKTWLDINKSYHLYQSFNGAKPYLAETAILELCRPREGEQMTATEYVGRVGLMLLKWHQVSDASRIGVEMAASVDK